MSKQKSNEKHPLEGFEYCPKCGSKEFVENNFKSKRCEDCGFIYYLNPSTACACIITDRVNNVLVAIRRYDPAQGTWDLPGGFIDPFESVEAGMAREVLEETGIDVKQGTRSGVHSKLKYLFSIPNVYPYSDFDVHTTDLFYHIEVESVMPYVGQGRDDVAELIAVHFSELEPEKFGLASVRQAIKAIKEKHLL
ncbi:NUDIX domain-containing protein [Porphyromonadaceae bacterium W3.11]|nr:NUDIX domain-containing protein [Porphyromonadaceae bacterium W3.11]